MIILTFPEVQTFVATRKYSQHDPSTYFRDYFFFQSCLPKDYRCDSVNQCPDESDENDCDVVESFHFDKSDLDHFVLDGWELRSPKECAPNNCPPFDNTNSLASGNFLVTSKNITNAKFSTKSSLLSNGSCTITFAFSGKSLSDKLEVFM